MAEEDFRLDAERIFGDLQKSLSAALVDATEGVRNEAIRLIRSGPKSGRIYRRRGILHQASAPGESPASDTGNLMNSITTSYKFSELEGTVNFAALYAPFLEYGTSRMSPRPYAQLALSNSRIRIRQRFEQAINRVTQK